MSDALTPSLALDYLRELSADIRRAAVLSADGATLAGDAALAARAHGLLAGGGQFAGAGPEGLLVAAADGRHAVAVDAGPLALPGLVLHDLRTVLAELAAAPARPG